MQSTFVCTITVIVLMDVLVRLVDGLTEYEGRVEVYHNDEWGTVCDEGWDLNDAQVVCKQLGFDQATVARNNAYYGQGKGQIWLKDLNCVGTELTIEDCSHGGWRIENCTHSKDAGVKCSAGNFCLNNLLYSLCV